MTYHDHNHNHNHNHTQNHNYNHNLPCMNWSLCTSCILVSRLGGGIYTKAADVGADMVGDLTETSVEFERSKNKKPQLPRIDVGIFFWGGGWGLDSPCLDNLVILLQRFGLEKLPNLFVNWMSISWKSALTWWLMWWKTWYFLVDSRNPLIFGARAAFLLNGFHWWFGARWFGIRIGVPLSNSLPFIWSDRNPTHRAHTSHTSNFSQWKTGPWIPDYTHVMWGT